MTMCKQTRSREKKKDQWITQCMDKLLLLNEWEVISTRTRQEKTHSIAGCERLQAPVAGSSKKHPHSHKTYWTSRKWRIAFRFLPNRARHIFTELSKVLESDCKKASGWLPAGDSEELKLIATLTAVSGSIQSNRTIDE